MNLYYKIWVDCIIRLRTIPKNKDNWKLKSMIMMTSSMSFNMLFILVILQKSVFYNYFYEINFSFLTEKENYVLTIILLYAFPITILNYFLIFYKNRIEKLTTKYCYHDGKLILRYLMISWLLPIITLIAGMIYSRYL
jgi:hypothetical protein